MRKSMKGQLAGLIVLISLIGFGGWAATKASDVESPCPGKVTCPITGQLICIDKCPLQTVKATPVKTLKSKGSCCSKKG